MSDLVLRGAAREEIVAPLLHRLVSASRSRHDPEMNALQESWARTEQITALASSAARAVPVPFLVVDVAQTDAGEWIVIECNDAQECSYGGVVALSLWQRIAEMERGRSRLGTARATGAHGR